MPNVEKRKNRGRKKEEKRMNSRKKEEKRKVRKKKGRMDIASHLVGQSGPTSSLPPRPGLHLERNEKYGMGNCYVAIGSWDRPVGSWEWKIGSATMRWNAQNMNCWNGTS